MIQVDSTSPSLTALPGVVELQVPAELDQLLVVRTVAETIAARDDFDLDAVADVKLAVDEVSACLIAKAVPGARLDCRFALLPNTLEVVVSTTTRTAEVPNRHSFGWHVLATLTDTLAVEHFPLASDAFDISIRFTKRKTVHRQ
jgi:serine/threonine-protein kinase RsbW